MKNSRKGEMLLYAGVVCAITVASTVSVAAIDLKIGDTEIGSLRGYLRTHVSVNVDDSPELDGFGRTINGKGQVSMARSTLNLQFNRSFDFGRLTLIGRIDRELETGYLEKLNDNPAQTGDLMDYYNNEELREAYFDFSLGRRVSTRLGKQQVVWGETDLFQALDIVHGRDLTWRSVLEPEDEEWRKPLIMANVVIDVPEANGDLQLLYRPGWDGDDDPVNSLDLFGGRWAAQPDKGINTLATIPFNFNHPDGDTDDPSYGFRWNGVTWNDISYSLAYYRTFNLDPILNVSAPALGITPFGGYIGSGAGDLGLAEGAPAGLIMGEFIFPQVDVLGASANAYVAALDTVFRAEMALTLDKPFNAATVSGLPRIVEKEEVSLMIGFDKLLRLMDVLGTDQPSMWTVQLFDSWVPSFDDDDGLLDIGESRLKEHSAILVTTLGLSYRNNTVQPSLILAHDVTYGGGVFNPSISFIHGDHWRLRVDAALFYKSGNVRGTSPDGSGAEDMHLFGTFDNNSQVSARLTYQF